MRKKFVQNYVILLQQIQNFCFDYFRVWLANNLTEYLSFTWSVFCSIPICGHTCLVSSTLRLNVKSKTGFEENSLNTEVLHPQSEQRRLQGIFHRKLPLNFKRAAVTLNTRLWKDCSFLLCRGGDNCTEAGFSFTHREEKNWTDHGFHNISMLVLSMVLHAQRYGASFIYEWQQKDNHVSFFPDLCSWFVIYRDRN